MSWCNERAFIFEYSLLINLTSVLHDHHSLHQNLRTDTRNLVLQQLLTRWFSNLVVKITWAIITFFYKDMFTIHSSQKMRKSHHFSNCFAIFKLMKLCKKNPAWLVFLPFVFYSLLIADVKYLQYLYCINYNKLIQIGFRRQPENFLLSSQK